SLPDPQGRKRLFPRPIRGLVADPNFCMELDEIERRTREVFTPWKNDDLSLAIIEKGGSGRLFVRVAHEASGGTLIAMHYNLDRADNARFASVTDFLNRLGIPAPRILERRIDLNLLWVEDLG